MQNSGHNFNLHLLYPDVYRLLSIRLRKATLQNKRATNKSKAPLFEKEFYQSATPLLEEEIGKVFVFFDYINEEFSDR